MHARLVLPILIIGLLSVSATRAQAAESQGETRAEKPSPGAPAPEATKDLKASVEALDKDVKDLQAALQLYKPCQADRSLQSSLYFASLAAALIVALMLVTALVLWQATRKFAGLATQNDVNAARDQARAAILDAINAASERV